MTGGAEFSVALDFVNGSGPVLAAAWRNTSPLLAVFVEPPSDRVKTRPSTTAATTTAVRIATRGTDFHQGRCGSGAPVPPPEGCEGGPEGGWEGPDSGPEGGPVGRPEDGGSTLTSSSSRRGLQGHSYR